MGDFIGNMGGALMIALIAVLAFCFVRDIIGKKDEDIAVFMKDFMFYAIAAVAGGAALFILGGVMYFHAHGSTTVFDIETIWGIKPMQEYLIARKYSLVDFTELGMLPLFPVLVSVLSGFLFDLYVECGFYISFICGVITTVCLGFILRNRTGRESAMEYILLFLCAPGVVLLFLPSSFAMFAALCALVLLGIELDKKYLTIICTILCLVTHLYGLAVLVLVIVAFAYKGNNRNIINAAVLAAALFVLSIVFYIKGYVCIYEMWFVYLLPACLVVPALKENSGVAKYAALGLILLNSLYMTGLTYNVF